MNTHIPDANSPDIDYDPCYPGCHHLGLRHDLARPLPDYPPIVSHGPPELTRQERVFILAGRIYELIPNHPAILGLDADRSPYVLFRIPELVVDDLQPELMELRYALAHARIRWRNRETV